MNIRCERCSTTYELDETLLAPEGSAVQCTKCQHVFIATPPRAAGRTLVGVPAAPPPHHAPVPRAPPGPAVSASPSMAPSGFSRQGPAIYRPATPSQPPPSAVRAPQPQRGTIGAFEARLRANARLRWLIPLGAGICAALVLAIWLFVSARVDPVAARRHAEAVALVAQDDIESLEKATGILDDIARKETGIRSLPSDRALARILLATGLLEEVAVPLQRLTAKLSERERIAAAQPPPSPEVLGTLAAEVEALRTVVEPRQSRASELSERAYTALKQLSAERGNEIEVARALAVYFASVGDREQALRFIRTARGPSDRDPWMQLAEGWLDAREDGKEPRERAVVKLAALAAARPDIVRARYLLARTQAALGWREAAAATLDGLLAANPRHRRASRMRAELVGLAARPATVPAAPPATAPAPAPGQGARPIAPAPGQGARPLAPAAPPPAPPQAPTRAPAEVAPAPVAPQAPRPAAPAPPAPPVRPASEATESNFGGQ